MTLRTIENFRLIDGEKIDNLPADTISSLDGKVEEAPTDGKQYARQNSAWSEVTTGGGGAVDSVNGKTGTVVLDADDIDDAATTNKYTTAGDISKLSGIEASAEVNQTDAEIKTQYENNADTNAFTDAEKTKLGTVGTGADMTKAVYDPNNINDDAFNQIVHFGLNHGVVNPNVDLLTAGTVGTFNLTPIDHFIDGVKGSFVGVTNQDPGFLVGEQFAFIGVNAGGLVIKKNLGFNLTERETILEIGVVRSFTGGPLGALDVIADSAFFLTSFQRRDIVLDAAEGPFFLQGAAKTTENAGTPRQLDLAAGDYFDINEEKLTLVGETNALASSVNNVAGTFVVGTPTLLTVSNTEYDNGTDLVTADDNKYLSHTILFSGRTGVLFFVFSTAQYDSLQKAMEAEPSSGPLEGISGADVVPIGQIVLKKDDVHISNIVDLRRTDTPIMRDMLPISDGVINLSALANGSIIETARITVTSDGATVTLSVDREGGGDLTMQISEVNYNVDTTPADTIQLTSGSDTSPQVNYSYYELDTGVPVLKNSTTGFPDTEYVPIALSFIQSVASVQADGAMRVSNYTDHIEKEGDNGHLTHINEFIRQQNMTFISGMSTTTNPIVGVEDANLHASVTSGEARCLEHITSPAYNTETGTEVYVANDFTTPFKKISNLNETTSALGASMTGRRYNLVLWQVINSTSSESKLMLNMPTGDYGNNSDAINDTDNTSVTTIPGEFKGDALLLARISVRHRTAGPTFEVISVEDLRGLTPGSVVGGSGSAIKNEFSDNVFRVTDDGDNTKKIAFQASALTTSTTRTVTMPDTDIDLGDVALNTTHRTDTANPHTVTKTQVGLTNVTDDAQLKIASNLSDVASQQTALDNVTNVSAATDEFVLTKDTATGNAVFKAAGGGGGGLSWGDTIDGTAESTDGITISNIPNTFAGINTTTFGANSVGFESSNTAGKGVVLTATGVANAGVEINDTSTSNKYSTSLKIEQHDNDGFVMNVRDGSAFSRPMLIRDLGTLTSGITFSEINTGSDAQGHTALKLNMDNASTSTRHIKLTGSTTGGGIEFPDATVQTTAAVAGGLSASAVGATRSMTASNATITHSHSLGKIPSIIEISGTAGSSMFSFGTWINGANRTSYMRKNGTVGQISTVSSMIFKESDNTGQAAIINNVTSTNFDVVWTRASGAASATIAVGFTILG